jgi:hypothetical protein
MNELRVDFSENYSYVIYFEITSNWGNNFLISENFEPAIRAIFPSGRQYFNLNHMLNLKHFKIEISE